MISDQFGIYDDYKIGDDAWIFGISKDHKDNPLTMGKVVHIFTLYSSKQYIIEIETSIDPILECRSAFTMRRFGPHPDDEEDDELEIGDKFPGEITSEQAKSMGISYTLSDQAKAEIKAMTHNNISACSCEHCRNLLRLNSPVFPGPYVPPTWPWQPSTNPYPWPTATPTLIVKTPWQCPGCKTFYSPDTTKCECQRVTSINQGAL